MAWHSQQNDRPPESAHAVAWAALFFSLLACAMSGIALFRGHDAGQMGRRIKENIKHVGDEASKFLKKPSADKTATEKKKTAASSSIELTAIVTKTPEDAFLDKEKIKEKVDDLRTMVDKGDDRAVQYLESIKRDLGQFRDYTAEKGGPTLQRTADKLREVGERLRDDSTAAAKKLKELSDELGPRVKALVGSDEDEKPVLTPTPTPLPSRSAR